jgi:hypothetical protein
MVLVYAKDHHGIIEFKEISNHFQIRQYFPRGAR